MDEIQRRARLIQWIEVIYSDVEDLLIDDHIFWELQEVVEKNPRFKESSGLFTQWMASSFIQATAVGVRRQAKSGDESISLRRFLHELQKYPWLVSRKHYMSFYAGKEAWLVNSAQRNFDCLAGEGSAHIPLAVVEEHLQELTQGVKAIEHYVDRRIAHYDRRGLAQPTPTLADLQASLKTLENIVAVYWEFLRGISRRESPRRGPSKATMLPIIPPDWKEIFQFSWLSLPHDDSSELA